MKMLKSQSLQMTNLPSLTCGYKLQEMQLWGDLGMHFSITVSSFTEFEHIGGNVCNVVNA